MEGDFPFRSTVRHNGKATGRIEKPSRCSSRENPFRFTRKGVITRIYGFFANNTAVNVTSKYGDVSCSDGVCFVVEFGTTAVRVASYREREHPRIGIEVNPHPMEHGVVEIVEN